MNKRIAVILAVIVLPMFMASTPFLRAVEPTKINVTPYENRVSSIGETFIVNLTITEMVDTFSWEIEFHFNPSLLRFVSYRFGDLFSSVGQTTHVFDDKSQLGMLKAGETFMAQEVASGSGTLVSLNFSVLNGGRSRLDIYNSTLYNADMQPLSHTSVDGIFALQYLIVTPQNTGGAFAIQGFGFSINQKIQNITLNETKLLDVNASSVVPTPLTTDDSGNFVAIAIVPEPNKTGNYTLAVRDKDGEHAEASLTVVATAGPQGPQGSQGPQGPAGQQGSAGPAGADASAEYTWGALILAIVALIIAAFGLIKKK